MQVLTDGERPLHWKAGEWVEKTFIPGRSPKVLGNLHIGIHESAKNVSRRVRSENENWGQAAQDGAVKVERKCLPLNARSS